MKLVDWYKGSPLTNEQMIPNRYGRMAKARALFSKIQSTLAADGIVMVSTHTRHTEYRKKHADMFRLSTFSVYVQSGKRWDCIDFCNFTFYTRKAAA